MALLCYTILRSNRKTIALEIRPDGSLLVRAPRHLAENVIDDFVASKREWVERHLGKYQNRSSGSRLTPAQLEELGKQALAWFPKRVACFAPQVGVSYGRITIRNQRTRWGSCSGKGNLNFNCLLMLAPPEIRDYIVVHELCHRKQMNHSPLFWAEVERVLPDYRWRQQWLKDNGASLLSRLPD